MRCWPRQKRPKKRPRRPVSPSVPNHAIYSRNYRKLLAYLIDIETEQAEQEINQADVSVATAWVMGNEAKGMRQQVAKSCDQLFIIPTATQFTTLNVAMTNIKLKIKKKE